MPRNTPYPPAVFFSLTVDQDLSLAAQNVLRRECGPQIYSITLESIPNRHEMRLWVTLATTAFTLAVHAVIAGLPAADFGAVKMAKADITASALVA